MKRKSVTITAKVLCFLLVFGILFSIVQWVFQYKGREAFYLQERFDSYKEAVENGESIDVVSLGTSSLFRGMVPMVMYEETGITSFNFGGSMQNAMCEYYLLKSILEIQVPKVVILDFCSLFENRKAEGNEKQVYLMTVDNIPDYWIRQELMGSIIAENEEIDRFELSVPLFRTHSRWRKLKEQDYLLESNYEEFQKGCLFGDVIKEIENASYISEEQLAQETETLEINEESLKWYEKTLALCKENNIQVLAVSLPNTLNAEALPKYKTYIDFCEEKGIPYINYTTQEQIAKMQINDSLDYCDTVHLNLRGGIKFSQALAQDLTKQFQLEDRREDPVYSGWDENWDEFYLKYKIYIDAYFLKA